MTEYDLKVATGRTTTIFLVAFLVFALLVFWAFARAMNMDLGQLFRDPSARPLAFVASLVAVVGVLFFGPNYWGRVISTLR